MIDQTRLPDEEVVLVCRDVPALVEAIRRLAIRGAPLLGIAGAYGVALAAVRGDSVEGAAEALAGARPTARNLAWAVGRVQAAHSEAGTAEEGTAAALAMSQAIAAEEAAASAEMARHGLELVPEHARVLTHCNTGIFAAGGEGTAFAVVAAAHRAGRLTHLWVDETRPLLQGARLTAYEAARSGMPYSILPDSAAGSLFAHGAVDLVLVGADRIAADGGVANKVGTYPLAVLAHHHGVPFVVVAPTSTIDLATRSGAEIVIEQRPAEEITHLVGAPAAPAGSAAYNPAFDVTPPHLVTAIVTERGVASPVDARGVVSLCDSAQNCVKR
ncbi:MAG: S-methyl-5-thioribose-1-phosphate isomerase [Streptosporangiales bacterium]|nr:S-methyl-5-thioribose-1-phosphate isomerase [Streptosporangiales bacterium]